LTPQGGWSYASCHPGPHTVIMGVPSWLLAAEWLGCTSCTISTLFFALLFLNKK
jgi:hypothetical protein